MKITKKTREDAALICELVWGGLYSFEACDAIGADYASYNLVNDVKWAAWHAMSSSMPFNSIGRDHWLEAAGLLRDGWCPGDPVEVRK